MHDLASGGIEKDLAQQSPALSSNSVQSLELDYPYFSLLCCPQTLYSYILYYIFLQKTRGIQKVLSQEVTPGEPLGLST